jgi:protein-tyrosine phosphatase
MLTPVLLTLKGPSRLAHLPGSVPSRLVFVCEGNICRSAYAAAYARAAGVDAVSFGLRASDGALAHATVRSFADKRQIEMNGHRARRFRTDELRVDDLVLTFEYSHALEIGAVVDTERTPVRLLGSVLSYSSLHIHDPYGLSPLYFERCLTQIERAVDKLHAWIESSRRSA